MCPQCLHVVGAVLQVLSAARVHNRHLRLQFDRLQGNSGDSDDSKRQCTDYLFYGEHPALPGECNAASAELPSPVICKILMVSIHCPSPPQHLQWQLLPLTRCLQFAGSAAAGELMHVVQHGFRSCSDYSSQGLDGAVRLANCVNLADQLRMHLAILQASAGTAGSASSSSSGCVLEGQLLVCKVHLGGALQEAEEKVQLAATAGEQQFDTHCLHTASVGSSMVCRLSGWVAVHPHHFQAASATNSSTTAMVVVQS
jgi:hypothetical protein